MAEKKKQRAKSTQRSVRVTGGSERERVATTGSTGATSAEAGSEAKAEPSGEDVVLVHGKTPDGEGLQVLRSRRNRIEAGTVRPLKEGKPITGELVSLKPRKEMPLLCDVESHLEAPGAAKLQQTARSAGPAQVASDDYRKNWDAIWKRRRKSDAAN